MARMSNTIVESSVEYPREKLKEMLIEEVKKQNKPFGLLIKSMRGGETNTSSYNFQAFRGRRSSSTRSIRKPARKPRSGISR